MMVRHMVAQLGAVDMQPLQNLSAETVAGSKVIDGSNVALHPVQLDVEVIARRGQ